MSGKGGVESGTRDLYEVLEVAPSASETDIRASFRKLAAKYHPDRNTTPHAAIHFKRVNAAYQVLGDPARREAYDSLTGQVDPAPAPGERTDPLKPIPTPTIDGWYLTRNGAPPEGPFPPQVIVNWIASGLREGSVRFGAGGQWHYLSQSIFAKFIPQTMPPPTMMGPDPSLPPPRLLYVSDGDIGKKSSGRALKIVGLLVVLVTLGALGFFFRVPILRFLPLK